MDDLPRALLAMAVACLDAASLTELKQAAMDYRRLPAATEAQEEAAFAEAEAWLEEMMEALEREGLQRRA